LQSLNLLELIATVYSIIMAALLTINRD